MEIPGRFLLQGFVMKTCFLFLSVLFLVVWGMMPCPGAEETMNNPPKAGGPCEYHRYDGSAEITSLQKVADPYRKGEEVWEVKFRFVPTQEIKESFAQVTSREFLLEIHQSSYLRPEFIEEHGIQVGKTFHGSILLITRGTCTPILFEFPALSSQ